MNRLLTIVFALFLLLGPVSGAQAVDIPWTWIHNQLLASAAAEVNVLVGPFSAETGFPKQLPANLQGKNWETIHRTMADASVQASQVVNKLLADAKKYALPLRLQLGLRYFALRLSLGGKHYPHLTGNERALRFLCHTFAQACQKGLLELKFFIYPEPLFSTDFLFVPKGREGLLRVKQLLPMVPADIAPEQAEKVWREMALMVAKAGNEAGLTGRMMGCFDFPAWRLQYAVKSFQLAAKVSVSDCWDKTGGDGVLWQKACEKLSAEVTRMRNDIDEFVATLKP